MPQPSTAEQFLDLVRQSGVLERQRLDGWLVRRDRAAPLPAPRMLAELLVREGLLTGFQARRLLLGTARGFTVGKYTLLERLGAGGAGTVFLAAHPVMLRRVALKVLPPGRADGVASVERFIREARAGAALDHPNIVRVHDLDRDGELHFLVMEYVDGSSLQEIVEAHGPMDVTRAAHYIRQAAAGLQHVHRAGLVHRDIKPANLLLDRRGTVKVLDLGLARFFNDPGDALTQNLAGKGVLGTADYLAPEQGLDSHAVDARADLYGLGATFYFLLAGRPPFAGKTVTQKLLAHQVQPPPPLRSLRPEVPEGLAAVVAKLLAKAADQRYPTAAAVAEALAPWTRTLIPPPPAAEMPRLSPAAVGYATESGLLPAAPTLAQVGDTDMGPAAPRADPVAPTRPMTAPVVPPPTCEKLFQFDTEAPSALEMRPRSPARSWHLLVGAAAAVALLATFAGGVFLWHTLSQRPRPADGTARQTRPSPPGTAPRPPLNLVVTQSGRENTFRSVREALLQARPGDRVLVQDAVHAEQLGIVGPLGEGVLIEGNAGEGRPVVWQAPPDGDRRKPLIALTAAARLRLRGFVLDGQGQVADLLAVSGHCPGLTLEDVKLQGFTRRAARLTACTGSEEQRVNLTRLRSVAAEGCEAALLLEAGRDQVNQYVQVQGCRFEGPCAAAVELAGPAADVRLERNRFFQSRSGVLYRQAQPRHRLNLALVSSTFCDVDRALHLEVDPPAMGGSQLVVHNNLFLRTGKPVLVDKPAPKPQAVRAQWVWRLNFRDGESGESSYPFMAAQVRPFKLDTDPENDARFLRSPRGNPQFLAGPDRTPLGVPSPE